MDNVRTFLKRALASGLECGTLTSRDLFRHVNAKVLAFNLPNELKAKLLSASLSARDTTPDLIVETIGIAAMAQYLPPRILWACLAEAAQRLLDGKGAVSAAPAKQSEAESLGAAPLKPAAPAPIRDSDGDRRPPVLPGVRGAFDFSSRRKSIRADGGEFDSDDTQIVGDAWADDIVEVVEEGDSAAAQSGEPGGLGGWGRNDKGRSSGS